MTWDIQRALYQALKSANVAGGNVYDEPPRRARPPYVNFGAIQSLELDTTGGPGGELFVTLDAWSDHKGWRELHEIEADIRAALHTRSFTVPGLSSCTAWVTDARHMRDPDGETRHGIITVRIIHQR